MGWSFSVAAFPSVDLSSLTDWAGIGRTTKLPFTLAFLWKDSEMDKTEISVGWVSGPPAGPGQARPTASQVTARNSLAGTHNVSAVAYVVRSAIRSLRSSTSEAMKVSLSPPTLMSRIFSSLGALR